MKILEIRQESLVSSRKFNMINKVRSTQNELISNYFRLTTKIAFTMAEILLSLTIIGVVAAITLPSLTGNINERTWNTQRKALYSRFSQAIALMPALNGYGNLEEGDPNNVAETFVTNGLAKVLKINNICSHDKLSDCGLPAQILPADDPTKINFPTTMQDLNVGMVGSHSNVIGLSMNVLDTKAAAFETANGESVAVYYNPRCVGSLKESPSGIGGVYIAPKMCANFIYDLNGKKGPNTVGKDIGFMTAVYPSDVHVVAPEYGTLLTGTYKIKNPSGVTASEACKNSNSEYRLPNSEEALSIAVNYKLISYQKLVTKTLWSSTPVVYGRTVYWSAATSIDGVSLDDYGEVTALHVACVKR